MKINVWIYQNRRTNPGRIHRIGADGNAIGVVEILLQQDVDGKDGIELRRVDPQHLPPDWSDPAKQWGPNGEWLGARGILFIYEDEYPELDPHEIFRQYESIRSKPPTVPVTQEVDAEGEPVGNQGGGTDLTDTTAPAPVAPESAPPESAPPEGSLPPSFPGHAALEAAGITTYNRLRKIVAKGKLEDVPGIGPVTAKEIEATLAG